jgi:Ca2+-transporting ATPase
MASEPVPFDPMEKRYKGYQKTTTNDTRRQFSMIHEYPLDGKPMMTHVFENKEGKRIIAAKAVQKRL